jgi:hypothetical protein
MSQLRRLLGEQKSCGAFAHQCVNDFPKPSFVSTTSGCVGVDRDAVMKKLDRCRIREMRHATNQRKAIQRGEKA